MRMHIVLLLVAIPFALPVQPVFSGTIPFFDDFEDGDYADQSPLTWHNASDWQGNGGTREVEDGSLIISGTQYTSFWVDDTLDTTDLQARRDDRRIEVFNPIHPKELRP